jgi:hypothetical protein
MITANQIANEVMSFENFDANDQTVLVLDALDLLAVGGGGDYTAV